MKLINITDVHMRIKSPRSRTDTSFVDTVLGKLRWVFETARKEGATAILCAGDLGDLPVWGTKVSLGFIRLLKSYPDIEFITVIGNHDVVGSATSTVEASTLSIINEFDNFTILKDGNCVTLTDEYDNEANIIGYGFGEEATKQFLQGSKAKHESNAFNIALVHATVGPSDKMDRWHDIKEQNINPDDFDLALFGDVHIGFDLCKTKNGVPAYSPGALVRLNKDEVDREVKIGIITLKHSNYSFDIEDRLVPVSDDVFVTTEDISYDDLSKEFKDIRIASLSEKRESIKDRVFRVCQELAYEDEIAELVLSECIEKDES